MIQRAATSLVFLIRTRPGTVLAWVLGLHLVLWTIVPALVSGNLQLDLVEGLALGKEWQLGYWKHPPLPWWIDDAAYRLTGTIYAVYLLGPLSAVICLYAVWRVARDVTTETNAIVAVLTLEGLHFLNFSAVKFSHDPLQLPVWALTGLFAWRAIGRGKNLDWALAGFFLALAFWTKYSAVVLGASIGLVLLIDRDARRRWLTPGPYVMAAVFLVAIAPHVWWLVTHDFLPMRYADMRAENATHWYQYITFPAKWTVSQIGFVAPAAGLMGLLCLGGVRRRPDANHLARTVVTALALGPFVLTTAMAALLGKMPVAMWGFPMWIFAPLAFLMWFEVDITALALRRFATGVAVLFFGLIVSYAVVELFEPLLRQRSKATHFPGRVMAETVTAQWRARTGQPLRYVGGIAFGFGPGEFAANMVAVYSPDHPHVVAHGDIALSPWIDPADLRRKGAVIVWQPLGRPGEVPDDVKRRFPTAEPQPTLFLPQTNRFARQPVAVDYAFVPPETPPAR